MNYMYLLDAGEETGDLRYGTGRTEVWYANRDAFRDLSMGLNFALKRGVPIPTSRELLTQTHHRLGVVDETDLEEVFMMMQGERWSPEGQAAGLIRRLGLSHTSMSIGDVVVLPNGKIFMVDSAGFKLLSDGDFSRTASTYPGKISVASLPKALKLALAKTRLPNKRAIGLMVRPSYTLYSAGDDGAKGFTFVVNVDTGAVDEHWGTWGGGGLGVKPSPVDDASSTGQVPLSDHIAVLKGQVGGRDPYALLILSPGGFDYLFGQV